MIWKEAVVAWSRYDFIIIQSVTSASNNEIINRQPQQAKRICWALERMLEVLKSGESGVIGYGRTAK
jgi:hypothetical protein